MPAYCSVDDPLKLPMQLDIILSRKKHNEDSSDDEENDYQENYEEDAETNYRKIKKNEKTV